MLLTVIVKTGFDLGLTLEVQKYRNVNGDEVELELTWNGVGENLDLTLIINKAKLTTSQKNNAKLTTSKIQVDHLCKNEMLKTQNSS